jgi:hypothetical protein
MGRARNTKTFGFEVHIFSPFLVLAQGYECVIGNDRTSLWTKEGHEIELVPWEKALTMTFPFGCLPRPPPLEGPNREVEVKLLHVGQLCEDGSLEVAFMPVSDEGTLEEVKKELSFALGFFSTFKRECLSLKQF